MKTKIPIEFTLILILPHYARKKTPHLGEFPHFLEISFIIAGKWFRSDSNFRPFSCFAANSRLFHRCFTSVSQILAGNFMVSNDYPSFSTSPTPPASSIQPTHPILSSKNLFHSSIYFEDGSAYSTAFRNHTSPPSD